MSSLPDLTNRTFGRLTVLRRDGRDRHKHATWLTRCDCGTEKVVCGLNLASGNTRSCGCLHREELSASMQTHGATKGRAAPRLYQIWYNMRKRCRNPNVKDWKYWGGAGVTVCDEWSDYAVFHGWALANGYRDDLTIDRYPNPAGNYEPNNCRWATRREQVSNRRDKT